MGIVKENFLINPPKRLKRKVMHSQWRPPDAKKVGTEGSKHRPTIYSHKGHWFTSPLARVARPGHKLNPFRRRRSVRRNPFGEEAMLVGLNPRKGSDMLFGRKRHERSRKHRRNPMQHRKYRRNPMESFQSYIPMVLGAAGGAVAVRFIPKIAGLATGGLADYGVRIATIVGGGYAVDKFIGKAAGEGFIAGSAAILVTDLLMPVLQNLGLAGYEAFPAMSTPILDTEMSGFGANPAYSDTYNQGY